MIASLLLLASSRALVAEAPRRLRVVVTYYWMIDESASRYRGAADSELRDMLGHVLARTSRKFRRDLIREGSGWLKDHRTVLVERKFHEEFRFRIAQTKWGYASDGSPLVPYHTISVDPRIIPVGSLLYIPQFVGAMLPDGSVHDGRFIASDRGHFRGRHVDLFVGAGSAAARPFLEKGCPSRSRVTVYIEKP